ncbi:MAG: hypothetical protein V3T33_00245 [Myxococcota bacterium]
MKPSALARVRNRVLFLLFFLSGFCGLAYQVVWIRLAFSSFGIITPVLSVVISTFMLGLALGAWLSGHWLDTWRRRTGRSAIYFYALAEVLIGIGALAVPLLFGWGESWLLRFGEMGSALYLLHSGLVLGLSILPWCLAMGATFPLMMGFMKEVDRDETSSFSFLYLANVIGAMTGVLLTAVVLIELLGFSSTLLVAATINFCVAGVAGVLGVWHSRRFGQRVSSQGATPGPAGAALTAGSPPSGAALTLAILFLTGFCAMGLEVIWTRAFTPVLGTLVYSFALILFTYLLATWLGSWIYRRHLAAARLFSTARLVGALAIATFLPILFNDPRLNQSQLNTLLSIFPLCALLGYLTPKLIDEYSKGSPESAGRAYAVNVFGSILGPLFACYLLLPRLGARLGMALLALPFLLLLALLWRSRDLGTAWRVTTAGGSVALLISALFLNVSYEEGPLFFESEIRRDHTATVVSYGEGMEKQLEVNGVGITKLKPVAKVMGHLPLAFLTHQPEWAVVICLGMGTTFRSLMSWNVDATAVELAGGVVDALPYYFEDASALLESDHGHIAVDDGRRFLQRTTRKFDVVTIDPPPPIEAAGSSLLYSKDFYELVKRRLKKGGLLHQWFPGGEALILNAVTRSLVSVFPHIKVFREYDGGGLHYLAAMEPFDTPTVEQFVARLPASAKRDLLEWNSEEQRDIEVFARSILSQEIDVRRILNRDPRIIITDDQPFNEYYLLRRIFPGMWHSDVRS